MQRYIALDALRGLTIAAMILVNTPGSWSSVYAPLLHAKWHGMTPTDLVFPFFLFIVGSAMFFALNKRDFQLGSAISVKVLKRGFLLFLIGFLLNIYPFTAAPDNWRIMGVLQRIGIAYICSAFIVLICSRQMVWAVSVLLLVAYHFLLTSVPGGYSLESNLVAHVDSLVLGPNHLYQGFGVPFDPEGLLSTLPAIVTTLIGFEVTRTISQLSNKQACMYKLIKLGIGGLVVGLALTIFIPINKPLWTSSYVICSAGFACLTLAFFVYMVDIKNITRPIAPLTMYGTNPLFIYVLSWVWVASYVFVSIGDVPLHQFMFNSLALILSDKMASLAFALAHVILFWWFSKLLYERNIFIKI